MKTEQFINSVIVVVGMAAAGLIGYMANDLFSDSDQAYLSYSSAYNGNRVSRLIKECETQENWGNRNYRYDWSLVIEGAQVITFKCERPKRTATDYRERGVTEY